MKTSDKRIFGLLLIVIIALCETTAADYCPEPYYSKTHLLSVVPSYNENIPERTWISSFNDHALSCNDPFCILKHGTQGEPDMGTHTNVINSGVTLITSNIGTTTTS